MDSVSSTKNFQFSLSSVTMVDELWFSTDVGDAGGCRNKNHETILEFFLP